MSENAYHVRTGSWYNYDNDVWTLTLSPYWAAILSAALVMYVGVIGSLSWNPVKLLLHQILTYPRARSVFAVQWLVILRNSSSPLGFAWDATKLIWCRRKRSTACTVVPLVILATLIAGGWTAAGFFVVWVHTTAGTDVLLAPRSCGYMHSKHSLIANERKLAQIWLRTLAAQTRVTHCSKYGVDRSECGIYPVPFINWTGSDTGCFLARGSICVARNSTPYMMDSGFMHSSRDLGIVAKNSDSVLLRRVTQCSPVHTAGFSRKINVSQTAQASAYPLNDTMQVFYFGPWDNGSHSLDNETYFYSEYTPLFPLKYGVKIYSNAPVGRWVPNVTFFDHKDASASLFMVTANNISYTARVDDPVFSATHKYTNSITANEKLTRWAPSFLVNPLVCMDQFQICNSNKTESDGCTSLSTPSLIYDATSVPGFLHMNQVQIWTARRLIVTILHDTMATSLKGRGGSGLLASRTLGGNLQVGLPIDQWRKEVGNLFSIQLAIMQQEITDYAIGRQSALLNDLIVSLGRGALDKQCHTQRISMTNSGLSGVNYNIKGLLVLLILGLVIGLLSLFIDDIVAWVQKHTGNWREYQRRAWINDGLLQILKEALAARGVVWEAPKDDEERIPTSDDKVPMYGNDKEIQDSIATTATELHTLDNRQHHNRYSSEVSLEGLARSQAETSSGHLVAHYELVPRDDF